MARQFAARLALIAFAATSIRGLLTTRDLQSTLETGLIATTAFYGLGLICGELARRVVEEHAEAEFVRLTSAETAAEE